MIGGAYTGTDLGSASSASKDRWSACACVTSTASIGGSSSSGIPGAETRLRKPPSVSSKFGSVSTRAPAISISRVACPMYVMFIAECACSGQSPRHGACGGAQALLLITLRALRRLRPLVRRPLAREQPLLRQRGHVLYRVVQVQPRREVPEEHREH